MLSGTRPAAGKAGGGSSAAAAGVGGGAGRGLTGGDLEALHQLQGFFNALVDDMSSSVQRLALRGFNAWLVST